MLVSPEPARSLDQMKQTRRSFLARIATLATAPFMLGVRSRIGEEEMYGLISKIQATPGQADALGQILLDGTSNMPGCLSYVVARDGGDPDSIWVTEVWESQTSHEASLSLPEVQAAIASGRPLIASFADRTVTQPIGGHGLA